MVCVFTCPYEPFNNIFFNLFYFVNPLKTTLSGYCASTLIGLFLIEMFIRLAIVDDDQVLAKTLKRVLEEYEELQSIQVYASGLDFVEGLSHHQLLPDVVLMDISMRLVDEGIRATRLLHVQYPTIKVIMFTVAEDDNMVFEAFKAGSVGYLLKNERPEFIHKTIVDVFNGGALMSPGIALKAIQFLSGLPSEKKVDDPMEKYHLSDRELEVLPLVAKGYTYEFIANQLFISTETVKKHISNIFRKLHVKNKVEAINKTRDWL